MGTIKIDAAERETCERLIDFIAENYHSLTDEGKAVFGIMLVRRLGPEMTRISEAVKSGQVTHE